MRPTAIAAPSEHRFQPAFSRRRVPRRDSWGRQETRKLSMSLDDEKTQLRALARRRRDAANQAAGPGAGQALRDNFVGAMAAMGIPAGGPVVAGYLPLTDLLGVFGETL